MNSTKQEYIAITAHTAQISEAKVQLARDSALIDSGEDPEPDDGWIRRQDDAMEARYGER